MLGGKAILYIIELTPFKTSKGVIYLRLNLLFLPKSITSFMGDTFKSTFFQTTYLSP